MIAIWSKAVFILFLSLSKIASASFFGRNSVSMMLSSASKSAAAKEDRPVPANPTTGNPHILLTGGAGYIGTHTVVCLIEAGYDVTVVDNLVNSNEESLRRVRRITGCDESRVRVYIADLCDTDALERVFATSPKFDACIHFAGLKAVGESVQKPLLYYQNNLGSTINLLNMMNKYGCRSIVFSSSATVRIRHHLICENPM
jgi:UDP-glucose 4-epimerase